MQQFIGIQNDDGLGARGEQAADRLRELAKNKDRRIVYNALEDANDHYIHLSADREHHHRTVGKLIYRSTDNDIPGELVAIHDYTGELPFGPDGVIDEVFEE
ncbi:MAG: hypothetical protein ABEN55_08735 [Bradymonadaceae bacterium]